MKEQIDLSIIIPAYKEGNEIIKIALDDLIRELNKTGRTYEILFMDNTGEGNSSKIVKEYSKKYDNFFGFELTHPGIPVTDKSNKYMLGYELARGKYIFHIDSEGKDRPEEIQKFIKKLDEGMDLVVGYKKNRKDSFFYVLTSRLTNLLTRLLTGIKIHDMNNGFKGMRAEIAKSLVLKGGNFRFIAVMLSARNKKIDEVVVEHRPRPKGKGKFGFLSRLRGGLFDLPFAVVLSKIGDTPIYFFGKTAILSVILGILTWFSGTYLTLLTEGVYKEMVGMTLQMIAPVLLTAGAVSLLLGVVIEYLRLQTRKSDYGLVNRYPEDL